MQIKADEQREERRSKKRERSGGGKKRILDPRLSFSWPLRSHTCTQREVYRATGQDVAQEMEGN